MYPWLLSTSQPCSWAEPELKEVSLSFWKDFFPPFGTLSVHSLATPRLKSISGYSNTISFVVPWSHIKCLSNYQHNHIWLLIVCVLVSFQKVPALAGCVGAWFLLPETEPMYLNKNFPVFHFNRLVYNPSKTQIFFFQFMFYCSLQTFLLSLNHYFPRLTLWKSRCVYSLLIKTATVVIKCETGMVPFFFLFMYSYWKQTHFKPLNIQTPDVPFVCLSSPVKY